VQIEKAHNHKYFRFGARLIPYTHALFNRSNRPPLAEYKNIRKQRSKI